MRSTLYLRALHCRICVIVMRTCSKDHHASIYVVRYTSLMLLGLVTPVKKEFTRHLDLLWRTRHPISPELAGRDHGILQGMCATGLGSKQWVMLVLFLSTDSYLFRDFLYGALA